MVVWLGRNVWKFGSLAKEKEYKHDNDSKYFKKIVLLRKELILMMVLMDRVQISSCKLS